MSDDEVDDDDTDDDDTDDDEVYSETGLSSDASKRARLCEEKAARLHTICKPELWECWTNVVRPPSTKWLDIGPLYKFLTMSPINKDTQLVVLSFVRSQPTKLVVRLYNMKTRALVDSFITAVESHLRKTEILWNIMSKAIYLCSTAHGRELSILQKIPLTGPHKGLACRFPSAQFNHQEFDILPNERRLIGTGFKGDRSFNDPLCIYEVALDTNNNIPLDVAVRELKLEEDASISSRLRNDYLVSYIPWDEHMIFVGCTEEIEDKEGKPQLILCFKLCERVNNGDTWRTRWCIRRKTVPNRYFLGDVFFREYTKTIAVVSTKNVTVIDQESGKCLQQFQHNIGHNYVYISPCERHILFEKSRFSFSILNIATQCVVQNLVFNGPWQNYSPMPFLGKNKYLYACCGRSVHRIKMTTEWSPHLHGQLLDNKGFRRLIFALMCVRKYLDSYYCSKRALPKELWLHLFTFFF